MPRLFFALWPDAPARDALAGHAQRLARLAHGRPVAAAKLHLTLVFLGSLDPDRVGAARSAASSVRTGGFDLVLDCVGSFRGAGVAWAGCRTPVAGLLALQSRLQHALTADGFTPESRAYVPHLTLVRRAKVALPGGEISPVAWAAKRFALVETLPDGEGYATLADWALEEGKN